MPWRMSFWGMGDMRHVKLFKNGRSQAVRIPKEFELPGTDAIMRRVGNTLVIEPPRKKTLVEALEEFGPVGEDFPEIADTPPEPVTL